VTEGRQRQTFLLCFVADKTVKSWIVFLMILNEDGNVILSWFPTTKTWISFGFNAVVVVISSMS
jgi:hypothetical protein